MPDQCKVLLVDDDDDVLRGASKRLSAAGYEVLVARDGDECLASAASHRPDAIILDVRMPRKDGLKTLVELQSGATTKDIPVVMLSASLEDQRPALEAGARFFLRKPYSGPMLINAVAKAIAEADMSKKEQTRQEPFVSCSTDLRRSSQPSETASVDG